MADSDYYGDVGLLFAASLEAALILSREAPCAACGASVRWDNLGVDRSWITSPHGHDAGIGRRTRCVGTVARFFG